MDTQGQLSPSRTTELLRMLNHFPIKKLGQNFLVDSNIVRKSLELADVREGDYVVEVGPGLGTLTGALLERGAKVFAVEIDKSLYAYLKDAFKDDKNLDLINADAVDMPLAGLPPEIDDFKIVANLPYAISTPWLDAVLESAKLPSAMSLMLQKEAASRFCARSDSKDFSPISICLGEAYEALAPHKVAAACFHPRPAVDSALLPLRKKSDAFIFNPRTKELMRKVFSKRRKQIASIARSADAPDAALLSEWLAARQDLAPDSRPETISPQIWRTLDEIVKKNLES